MKSLLTRIDVYGTKFHFFTFNKYKFQTWIGGILTIIIYILTLLLIYIFGNNFFYRKNPSSTFSTISENYEKIILSKEKVTIAFRLEDNNGFTLNMTDYFYPVITYYAFEPENEKYHKYSYEEKLKIRECVNKDFKNDENNNLLKMYGNLFCIDLEDRIFGGSWNNDFLFYFDIALYFCKDGQNYYINNTDCTPFEYLKELFINQSFYMTFYFSTINFRVNNINEPFTRKHDIHYCVLDNKLRKSDKIYIKKQILNDDKGWLFNNDKNYSVWGVDSIKTDYQYISTEEVSRENFSSYIYNANFYMALQKNYYTRRYAKIQDIIAIVGGLLTFFNFIGKTIYVTFNLSLKKIEIIDLFLDLNNNNVNKKINLPNDILNKNNSVNRLIKNNNINNTNNTNIKMVNSFKNSIDNVSNYNNIYLHLNDNFSNSYSRNKSPHFSQNKMIFTKNSFNSSLFKMSNVKMKSSSLLKIDLVSKNLCCCGRLFYNNKKNANLIKKHIYNLSNDIYIEKCDVINYFNTLKEIRFLKKMLLNKSQILSLKLLKKYNINEYSKFDINKSKKKIIQYFTNLNMNKTNSELDDFIFENIENNIKFKIISNKK